MSKLKIMNAAGRELVVIDMETGETSLADETATKDAAQIFWDCVGASARQANDFVMQSGGGERSGDIVVSSLKVHRNDWTEKKVPPPGENWDMILPVLNIQVDTVHVFASVSPEDDPPEEWAWIVRVDEVIDGRPSPRRKLVHCDSQGCFTEEEAIERASRAAENLYQVARLSLQETGS